MNESDTIRQIVVHHAVWDRLEQWLNDQGITLHAMPECDIPTYIMQPTLLKGWEVE